MADDTSLYPSFMMDESSAHRSRFFSSRRDRDNPDIVLRSNPFVLLSRRSFRTNTGIRRIETPVRSIRRFSGPVLSKFNSRLRLDAFSERMLHLFHLRHQIRLIQKRRRSSSTGDHHMLHRWTIAKHRQYLFKADIVILQRDIELVEDDHGIGRIAQEFTSRFPCLLCKLRVSCPILSFPGIAFSHPEEDDSIA